MKSNALVDYLAEKTGLPKYKIQQLFQASSEYIIQELSRQNPVSFPYIGKFEPKHITGKFYRDTFGDGTRKKHPDTIVASFKIKDHIRTQTKQIL